MKIDDITSTWVAELKDNPDFEFGAVRMGLEYEFYIGDRTTVYDYKQAEEYFKKNHPHISFREIKYEHGDQVELVTDPLPTNEAMKHMKSVFKLLEVEEMDDGVGLYASYASAFQISISYQNGGVGSFNPLKFAILMDSDSIHKIFPERDMVKNYNQYICNVIKKLRNEHDESDLFPIVEHYFLKRFTTANDVNTGDKYFTFKLSDYMKFDGRVELRFPGGEDYHLLFDEIKTHIAKAIMILKISYTNEYDDLYHEAFKQLYKKCS